MKFEKVTLQQYCTDCGYGDDLMEGVREEYESIKLPKRATVGSAGYDFYTPFSFDLEPHESIVIPTGIRFTMDKIDKIKKNHYVLHIYPRSGLGFKYQLGLSNTVAIIDQDYFEAKNEGHIKIKLVNNGNQQISINHGDGIAQGIISEFITVDDEEEITDKRFGGFGSTDR